MCCWAEPGPAGGNAGEKDVSKTTCHIKPGDLLPSCHAVSVMKLIRLPVNSTEVCQGAFEVLTCARQDDPSVYLLCIYLSERMLFFLTSRFFLLALSHSVSCIFFFNTQTLHMLCISLCVSSVLNFDSPLHGIPTSSKNPSLSCFTSNPLSSGTQTRKDADAKLQQNQPQ